MAISFRCRCGRRMEIETNQAGEIFLCPGCFKRVRSPSAKQILAAQIRVMRREIYGEDSERLVAFFLKVSPKVWMDVEAGRKMPSEVVLSFIDLTKASLDRLMAEQGKRSD